MKVIDLFERAYVINLPDRTDRRAAMMRELKQAEMLRSPEKVEIFPAIRPQDQGNFPSIGAHGCFMSHLSILKQAQRDGLANVLIMEDDLAIPQLFIEHQAALVDQLQQAEWDFVFFGHIIDLPQSPQVQLISWNEPIVTAHFYAVNGRIISQLVTFLEKLLQRPAGHPDGGPMHLDGGYTTFRLRHPTVKTLIASPNLGEQRSSRSDIYPNKWFDRWIGFKQLVGLARSVKTLLK